MPIIAPLSIRNNIVYQELNQLTNTAISAAIQEAAMVRYTPVGDSQQITVSNSVSGVGFAAFPATATDVQVTIQTAGVYMSQDGDQPTTADLHFVADNYFTWPVEMVTPALFIRDGSVDAKVSAQALERFIP